MVDHKLNIPIVLKAYEVIIETGESAEDGGKTLSGVTAKPAVDEYTIFLTDGRVTLYVYFHNKYQVDYHTREDYDRFVANLERIADSD